MPEFEPKAWENKPSTATRINADALIDLEERLSGYTDSKAEEISEQQNTSTVASNARGWFL
jgi:hypothetical protein